MLTSSSTGITFHFCDRLRFQNAIWHVFVLLAAAAHFCGADVRGSLASLGERQTGKATLIEICLIASRARYLDQWKSHRDDKPMPDTIIWKQQQKITGKVGDLADEIGHN